MKKLGTAFLMMVLAVAFFATTASQTQAQYKRHGLLEEGTGTWCGYCPFGAYWIDSMTKYMGDNLVVVSWHGPAGYNEPMYNAGCDTVASYVGATGYPWATIGRTTASSGAYPSFPNPWYTSVQAQARVASPVDFRIVNATYNPGTKVVDLDIDMLALDYSTMPTEDTTTYVTVGVLTEDGIVESQHRYAYAGLDAATIDDFHHYNVARQVGGKVLGDAVVIGTKAAVSLPARRHYKFTVNSGAGWVADSCRVKVIMGRKSKASKLSFTYIEANQTGYITKLPATAAPMLTVYTPRDKEKIDGDSVAKCIWSKGGGAGSNVRLEWTMDGGLTWNAGPGGITASPYSWKIDPTAYGHTVQIRMSDANNSAVKALSGKFDIAAKVNGTITVTAPSSGDAVLGGSTYKVMWTTTGTITAKRNVDLSVDNGATWSNAGIVMDGSNSFDWTVPDVGCDGQALIRITDDGQVTATSGNFTIQQQGTVQSVTVLGAPSLPINTTTLVKWNTSGYVGETVDVDQSVDNKTTWSSVAKSVAAGLNQCNWKTPNAAATDVYIRLTFNKGIVAYSNKLTITDASAVKTPAPGEFSLYANYPNPATTSTEFQYALGARSFVTISVLDVLGREVSRVVSETQDMGLHTATFNTKDLAAGTYTYRMIAGDKTFSGKLTITH